MLDWLENPDLRRRCHAGLNNSEQRYALTQAIYTFRQGRIIDRSHEAQQYRESGLNTVIAAIVYWNTIYMDTAAQLSPEQAEWQQRSSYIEDRTIVGSSFKMINLWMLQLKLSISSHQIWRFDAGHVKGGCSINHGK